MKQFVLYLVLPVLLLAWGRTAFYTVDYAEFAYVTRFGEPVATRDGESEAGLHMKMPWPIDSVLRVDHRLQNFDLPATEALTRDPTTGTVDKTLTLDAFMTWRVPDSAAADRFVRSVGTPEQVKRVLAPRITGRLASIIGGMSLDELISVPKKPEGQPPITEAEIEAAIEARSEKLMQQLLSDDLRKKVREEYGIEIVTLRVRRLSYPEAVRSSIYERIRSERGRKVADYENQGRKEAAELLSKADKDRREIEANARAKKQLLEGEADVLADQLRNEAHAKDPEFYAFLQKLKSLQAALMDTKDVLLLSLNHELFRMLREPPKPPMK